MMFEIRDSAGTVHRIDAADPETACARITDLHQVTVVAWRHTQAAQDAVHVYTGAEIVQ
jgi:hypothetical protein